MVLEGRTIIEYPTIFFGSLENTSKLRMRVAVVSGDSSVNEVCDDDCNSVRVVQSGDEKEASSKAIESSTCPSSSSSSSSDGLNGKRGIAECDLSSENGIGGEINPRQRIRFNDTGHTVEAGEDGAEIRTMNVHHEEEVGVVKEDEEEVEEEEEEEEDEEVFLSALKEFEAEDIDALKAYILAQEQS